MSQKREILMEKSKKRELRPQKDGEKIANDLKFMNLSEGFVPFGEHRI